MKNMLFLSSLFALITVFSACNESDPAPDIVDGVGTLQLNFRSTFNQNALVMYDETYDYEEDLDVRLQLFQFYITDVVMIGEDEQEYELSEVELVSFKEVYTSDDAADGINVTLSDLPSGKYTGIRFGIGVNPTLNATSPADYQIGHPLEDNYWSAAAGYVFFKIEGNTDLNKDGTLDDKLTFHIGRDDYLRDKELSHSFVINGGAMSTINLEVDLYNILRNPDTGQFLDFNETQTDHTTNPEVAKFLADNMQRAITIKE
ncbi:MAG: MbnP family protein [Bacteroidota bacterium]